MFLVDILSCVYLLEVNVMEFVRELEEIDYCVWFFVIEDCW